MKTCITKLNTISLKKERLIIGLMSGTSLDGLDIALCRLKNSGSATQAEIIDFETIPYSLSFKNEIKKICFKQQIDLEKLCLLNDEIGKLHGNLIKQFLISRNIDATTIDLIASHGQTVFHSPKRLRKADDYGNATLQIGDADQIATITGIITLADFRQKNIANGYEGAPLAIYGDYLLFNSNEENRVLLNIGGIANFTLLLKDQSFENVLSTDTGAGNTLMDQYVAQNFENLPYDKNAEIAFKGKADENLLNSLLNHPFFGASLPKTTGPELFNLAYLNQASQNSGSLGLSHHDILATLNRFTACGIASAVKKANCPNESVVYLSGGGAHNPLLTVNLKNLLPNLTFKNLSVLGINPDAKEALLFAILANETIAGNQSVFGKKSLSMGKISLPH
ncbi:anhydro-N-acetylmuramic acid kinase [Pedobacter arcticus]|uniref:anhydro-N-acetylmuramic acid kinase n=1 Tax=Pedobacter arcticus TaxID=752140 RepID=UPI0002FF2DF7|nr:anhydro-N-acetylmuramic acid kinase [Pedobacter arcticus]